MNTTTNGTLSTSNGSIERQWEEYEIPVPWGTVAGKWWGDKKKQPVIALHGWQDNCGTFDRLIPLLPESISVLAIDLPGHGKSSHYPKGMQYFIFWDGITLIRRIVKYHKWKRLVLMGHSLGGALSFMYASCFNSEEDTAKFISIDIAGPTVRDHVKRAGQTGDCIDKLLNYETLPMTKMPCYKYEEMIDLVLDAYAGSVDRESVKVLMRRGMAPAPPHLHKEGFHFARDLRLKVSIMGMFSEEQVLTYAKQIRCDVLNIRGKPGMNFDDPNVYEKVIEAMRENASSVTFKEVEGTHHLHLVTPERIKDIVTEFLLA
ncbi:CLUMA_CG006785, isoform A [Clunio marinus]|uniref:CLUMA_CG006785, isoform A n=1 Tax=Clunio marinus TaxID=568069 RepID=A0A1J1I4D1_9DIPT|nr:CLUMA_CG006785, isoform A [Clunio marinus]